MTYYLTAHTNDHARLIVSETRTTDQKLAALIELDLIERGYIVIRRQEG